MKKRKIDKHRSYFVQKYSRKKTITVPYTFKSYDFFVVLFGVGFILLSLFAIIGETEPLNIVLELLPGAYGGILVYAILMRYLHCQFDYVTIFYDQRILRIRRLWKTIDISFNDISGFFVKIDKFEGIIDSSGAFKGVDTYSCIAELVTSNLRRVKLIDFPNFHPNGSELQLIKMLKKEGISFIKEIGVSKPISWE